MSRSYAGHVPFFLRDQIPQCMAALSGYKVHKLDIEHLTTSLQLRGWLNVSSSNMRLTLTLYQTQKLYHWCVLSLSLQCKSIHYQTVSLPFGPPPEISTWELAALYMSKKPKWDVFFLLGQFRGVGTCNGLWSASAGTTTHHQLIGEAHFPHKSTVRTSHQPWNSSFQQIASFLLSNSGSINMYLTAG